MQKGKYVQCCYYSELGLFILKSKTICGYYSKRRFYNSLFSRISSFGFVPLSIKMTHLEFSKQVHLFAKNLKLYKNMDEDKKHCYFSHKKPVA